MSSETRRWRLFNSWPLILAGLALGVTAQAQEDDDSEPEKEEIVVTGSKIKRDAFSSISPVQVIGGQQSVEIGIVDTTQMIAESPFVFGTQLDGSTASGSVTAAGEGVPANGPGGATVALRGLGAERTLLLVNGRRLSPSGVRGAPVAPDLNLIPSAIIDRIEILTDGASSIYGADAVAGVANIILLQDFEGMEVRAFGSAPEQSGGEESLISFVGGAANDRSSFMVAAEYFNRERIMTSDRTDWNDCLRDIETTASGQTVSVCADRRPNNAAATVSPFGFFYYTPGVTDIGIPNFSTNAGAATFVGSPFENALNGDANTTPYNLQREELATQLQGGIERINLYATGKYNLTDTSTVYVETSYSQRKNNNVFTAEQQFPSIPSQIPQEDANGNIIVDGTGAPVLVDNPLNPWPDTDALPVVTLPELLGQTRVTDIDNLRLVFGIEGDMGAGWFGERGWGYDAFVSYEESSGTSIQGGLFQPNAKLAIDTLRLDSDGNLICGTPRTATSFGFISPQDCVVVDWFAPSLFDLDGDGIKSFATQEENDFLLGNVLNSTNIKQAHYSALATGELFDMSAGAAAAAFGIEYRVNSISSANDITRSLGLATSESPDKEGDTVGETWIADVYGEIELPVLETLTLNLSTRYTEEKNFGNETTWSAKAIFTPVDWLSLRSTAGTTFRAPNLREQFLDGTSGFLAGGDDPCVVPGDAVVGGVYDPAEETRSQTILDNCVQDGVDPTALGIGANVAIPFQTGGSDSILAETSESFTLGFVWSSTFTSDFELDVGVTYFSIDIEDTVEEQDPGATLARCYADEPNLASPFCDRITRRGVNPENNTVANVDASFVNIGNQTSKGVDINVRYGNDFNLFDRSWDLNATFTATNYLELEEQVNPDSPITDRVGEAGFPEWSWIGRLNFATGNWGINWRTRFVGKFAKDAEDVNASPGQSTGACTVVLGDATGCIRTSSGDEVFYHDVSGVYNRDDWAISFGIRNLLDENPPLVDQGEAPTRFNYVVQSTYDLWGRRYFVNLSKSF
ncbi:MAG: TonB-dependent receptor [Woeseiaceae bacterium]|nr:TonB-dependent receptor [Woeseiaceae bacterium]